MVQNSLLFTTYHNYQHVTRETQGVSWQDGASGRLSWAIMMLWQPPPFTHWISGHLIPSSVWGKSLSKPHSPHAVTVQKLKQWKPRLDWIEQCFTSPSTQYRLYGRRFLQVKRPNQQYQSTEGTYSTQTNQTYNNENTDKSLFTPGSNCPSLCQDCCCWTGFTLALICVSVTVRWAETYKCQWQIWN